MGKLSPSSHVRNRYYIAFLCALCCSGSVTLTTCGLQSKFTRVFSGDMKQPYSGCPTRGQTQQRKKKGFRTLHHDVEKLLGFGVVRGNEQIIINEPEQKLSVDD